jgi:hypothetical protein
MSAGKFNSKIIESAQKPHFEEYFAAIHCPRTTSNAMTTFSQLAERLGTLGSGIHSQRSLMLSLKRGQ